MIRKKIPLIILATLIVSLGVYEYRNTLYDLVVQPGVERDDTKLSARLVLSGQGLTKVPPIVFQKISLEQLDLSHNDLTGALPGEIRFLEVLRVLDVSYNQFTGVPAEIGSLRELRVLNLAHNKITGLPNELAKLKKLETLYLTGNDVSEMDLRVITSALPNLKVVR